MLMNKVEIEPVSIDPVLIRKVGSNDVSHIIAWASGYNGVNAFGEIQVWSTLGKCEISCDVYVNDTHGYIFTSGDRRTRFYLRSTGLTFVGDAGSQIPLEAYIDGDAVDVNGDHPLGIGWHQLRAVYATGSVRFIGSRHDGAEAWNGQISNIKLTDLEDPENTRFYDGILKTYVDPDSSDVSVPTDFVLVDRFGSKQVLFNDTIPLPEGSGYQTVKVYDGLVVGRMYYIKASSNLPQYNLIGSDISGYINRRLDQFFIATSTTLHVKSDGSGIGPDRVYIMELSESTDGRLLNFGNSQPWVPLLGDRDEYNGDYTNGDWLRGIASNLFTSTSTKSRPGSYLGKALTKIPTHSKLVSNKVVILVKDSNGHSSNILINRGEHTTEEIQKAFQYPNVFKVIKPSDPDYGDYL